MSFKIVGLCILDSDGQGLVYDMHGFKVLNTTHCTFCFVLRMGVYLLALVCPRACLYVYMYAPAYTLYIDSIQVKSGVWLRKHYNRKVSSCYIVLSRD